MNNSGAQDPLDKVNENMESTTRSSLSSVAAYAAAK